MEAAAEPLSELKLGKKYNVPSDEIYDVMVTALSSKKGVKVEGLSSAEKSKICARFMLINQDGQQFVAGRETRKPVLKKSDLANVS